MIIQTSFLKMSIIKILLMIFPISFSLCDAQYEIQANPLVCVTEDTIDLEISCKEIFNTIEKIMCQMILNDLNIIKFQKEDKYFLIDITESNF